MAADAFISSAASTMTTRRPPSAGADSAKKAFSSAHLVDRDLGLRVACVLRPRRGGSAAGRAPTGRRRRRATGWSASDIKRCGSGRFAEQSAGSASPGRQQIPGERARPASPCRRPRGPVRQPGVVQAVADAMASRNSASARACPNSCCRLARMRRTVDAGRLREGPRQSSRVRAAIVAIVGRDAPRRARRRRSGGSGRDSAARATETRAQFLLEIHAQVLEPVLAGVAGQAARQSLGRGPCR